MLLNRIRLLKISLPVKLTLWYALFFACTCGAIFLLADIMLQRSLIARVDKVLFSEARKYMDLSDRRKINILQKMFEQEAYFAGQDQVFFRMLSSDGVVLAVSTSDDWKPAENEIDPARITITSTPVYKTVSLRGSGRARMISLAGSGGRIFQLGRSIKSYDSAVGIYRKTGGLGLLIIILTGSILSYIVLWKIIHRVEDVRQTAVAIKEDNLIQRVKTNNNMDEIDLLANAFNDMLNRIALLIDELKILSSNIAHDLRGPIVRVRGVAEMAAVGRLDEKEWQESAGVIVEECDRLDKLISTMLEITRTEAGITCFKKECIKMNLLITHAVELFSSPAEDKNIKINLCLPEGDVVFIGDNSAVQRIVANLIDNALKYTHAGGNVKVSCEKTASAVRIIVSDTGVGISPQDIPHVFERFFRCEQSRTSEGTGLGLSLVQALVKAHNGHITVNSSPGAGSTFCVNLPV